MNLYQFAASMDNERANIYILSKILGKPVTDFNSLRIKCVIENMQKPLIFAALYSERSGLHNCCKVYPIEEVAVVDKPRYSLFDVLKNKIKI